MTAMSNLESFLTIQYITFYTALSIQLFICITLPFYKYCGKMIDPLSIHVSKLHQHLNLSIILNLV